MTLLNRFDLTSLPKQSVEMIKQYPQQFEQILGEFDSKSKKRRIRKKMLKTAVQRLAKVTMVKESTVTQAPVIKTLKATEQQTPTEKVAVSKAVDVTESFDFSKLPVGFVLKTGKRFFSNEDVFRFYYNQNHPAIYKNKELLLNQFKTLVNGADENLLAEIKPLLQNQLSS